MVEPSKISKRTASRHQLAVLEQPAGKAEGEDQLCRKGRLPQGNSEGKKMRKKGDATNLSVQPPFELLPYRGDDVKRFVLSDRNEVENSYRG